jgi:predicted O-methyltransferase YrrM
MSTKSIGLSNELYQYLLAISLQEPAVLRELRDYTRQLPNANMQIAPEQGQFMRWLVALIGAKRTLEVGVFTGYSTLATALALPDDGQIIACDISAEYTAIARQFWERAGIAHRIQLHLRPALETLNELLDEGQAGQFDFAFIDADKENYAAYFDACVQLLRRGGIVAVDNVLWDGRVIDTAINDSATTAIRRFNRAVYEDTRVALSLVPIGDGLTLARKL